MPALTQSSAMRLGVVPGSIDSSTVWTDVGSGWCNHTQIAPALSSSASRLAINADFKVLNRYPLAITRCGVAPRWDSLGGCCGAAKS